MRKSPPASPTPGRQLARVALALEEYYNEPQDVEWALEAGDGRIVVLQSRPLHEAYRGHEAYGEREAERGGIRELRRRNCRRD